MQVIIMLRLNLNDVLMHGVLFVQQFDLSSNTTSITIEIENKSNIDDIYHYPEIEFTLVDDATSLN